MNAIIMRFMVFLAILLADVGAKAQVVNSSVNTPGFVFSWMQDVGGNAVTTVTTRTSTNNGFAPAALDYFTSYHVGMVINNGDLSIDRQNILPSGPGATTAYYYGPTQIGANVISMTIEIWLTSKAKQGSSESAYNLLVNGVSLSETITADSTHPYVTYTYTHFEPITSFGFEQSISAVSDASETGMGVTMYSDIQTVPEPGTTSLILSAFGAALYVITRRKKIKI